MFFFHRKKLWSRILCESYLLTRVNFCLFSGRVKDLLPPVLHDLLFIFEHRGPFLFKITYTYFSLLILSKSMLRAFPYKKSTGIYRLNYLRTSGCLKLRQLVQIGIIVV